MGFIVFAMLLAASSAFTIKPIADTDPGQGIFGNNGTSDFYVLCKQEGVKCAGAMYRSELENMTTPDYTDCIVNQNCTRGIAMEINPKNVTLFHLFGTGDNKYISVGFSDDLIMGEEAVVSCVQRPDGVKAELSYNNGYKNERSKSDEGVELVDVMVNEEGFFCTFNLTNPLEFARNDKSKESEFFLIGVAGKLNEDADGTLGSHGKNHFLSGAKWALPAANEAGQGIFGNNGTSDFYVLCKQEGVKCAGAMYRSEQENITTPDYTDCIVNQNCTRGIAMETTSKNVTLFHLFGTGDNKYISVGFSDDLSMGEERVVSCVQRSEGVKAEVSYNNGKSNERSKSDEGVELVDVMVNEEGFFCTFNLTNPLEFARNDKSKESEFFLIGVAGKLNEDADGTLGSHGKNHFVSGAKWALPSANADGGNGDGDTDGAGAITASLILLATSLMMNLRL